MTQGINSGIRSIPQKRGKTSDFHQSSYAFVRRCVDDFFEHSQESWKSQESKSRKAETCNLIWELWRVMDYDPTVDQNGLLLLGWFLFDRKYMPRGKTLFLRADLVSDYIRFQPIWNRRQQFGDRLYHWLYLIFHGYCFRKPEVLELADRAVNQESLPQIREFLFEMPKELFARAARLQVVVEEYLNKPFPLPQPSRTKIRPTIPSSKPLSDEQLPERNFRNLQLWKKLHHLSLRLHQLTRKFPKDETQLLTRQIREGVMQLPVQVAQEFNLADNGRFLLILRKALNTLSELDYQLLLAKDLGYLGIGEFCYLEDRIREIRSLFHGLVKVLEIKHNHP